MPGPGGVLYRASGDTVLRFDGEQWETVGRVEGRITARMLGADGRLWLRVRSPDGDGDDRTFLRAVEDGWVRHEAGPRHLGSLAGSIVAADGALWYSVTDDPFANGGCDGIVRTDGTTTTHVLDDRCVHHLAVGPGGVVWATTTSWVGDYFDPESVSPDELIAITPEAWSPTD